MSQNLIVRGLVLPGLPHLVLCPQENPGWQRVRQAMDQVREEVNPLSFDVIYIYSTYWPSVIGHQVQARLQSQWVHVDEEFHSLGSIPYNLRGDPELAARIVSAARERKLEARAIDYQGFPIDTGSVVVSKIINPENRVPTVIFSSNIYADRAETVVLAKAARDVLISTKKKALAVIVTSLSNRIHTHKVLPKDDHIHSLKDQEWNLKMLEFLGAGRLEDVAQLSRQFHREARVNKVANFKPFWWLSALMGQSNLFSGKVLAYEAMAGSGAAVVSLEPASKAARDLEFDENDPEIFAGDRNVLGGTEMGNDVLLQETEWKEPDV